VTTIFGDVKLDLSKAELAPGDHTSSATSSCGCRSISASRSTP
jgi:hypothetical protein